MEGPGVKKAVIGVSGGLDSTLALLSTHRAFKIRNWNTKDIIAISMGGFGTTTETKNSAKRAFVRFLGSLLLRGALE